MGFGFQIQDDMLDDCDSVEELGKPRHSDAERSKLSYRTLLPQHECAQAAHRYFADAAKLLEILPNRPSFVELLIEHLQNRTWTSEH